MPSRTFLNLSEEKRQRIYSALYIELMRVPFPEMSINRVIKNADIPRGSFYQYFANKDDAFEFFVDESTKLIKESVIKRISTVHGDIFELCETVLDEIIKASAERKFSDIIQHIIPYINVSKIELLSEYIENMEREKRLEACSSLGIGNLDIKNEQEIMDIIGVIEAIYQSALPQIFSGNCDPEEIREKFRRKLDIVKRATLREVV